MFQNIFTPSTTQTILADDKEVTRKSIITTIKNNDLYAFRSILSTKNLLVNDSSLIDQYQNTLLHLSVMYKAYSIVEYLLRHNVDQEKINAFGETPFDLAVKDNNTKMIKTLSNLTGLKEDLTYVKSQNKILDEKVKDLKVCNDKLLKTNQDLTMKNNYLKIQLETEKTYKRKYDQLSEETTKLRVENDKIKDENKTLKKTVDVVKSYAKK
jgi:ankyrin repeat protein